LFEAKQDHSVLDSLEQGGAAHRTVKVVSQ
jgi:hypothetical protein